MRHSVRVIRWVAANTPVDADVVSMSFVGKDENTGVLTVDSLGSAEYDQRLLDAVSQVMENAPVLDLWACAYIFRGTEHLFVRLRTEVPDGAKLTAVQLVGSEVTTNLVPALVAGLTVELAKAANDL